MKNQILLVMSLFFFSGQASADDDIRTITIHGIGLESCGKYVAASPESFEFEVVEYEGRVYLPETVSLSYQHSEWFVGYLSAFNMYNSSDENIQIPDKVSLQLWVKNWCQKNPLKKIFDAAQALIEDELGYTPK